jgi:hypothetical protein
MADNVEWTAQGLISEFHHTAHTDEIHHNIRQPNENLILERNHRLRLEPEAFAKNDYMQPLASIPIIIWEKAIRDGYDLNCPDQEIANKELMRFLRSPEGKKCLTTPKKI